MRENKQMESERELSIGLAGPHKKLTAIPNLYLEMYGGREVKKLCWERKSWQESQPRTEPKSSRLGKRGQMVSAHDINTSQQTTAI